MSLELILAATIATQIIIVLRMHRLRLRMERWEVFMFDVMREGAPNMYKKYKEWETQQCSDK